MENALFLIIFSFLPLALLGLFAERNSSLAQPQRGSFLSKILEAYSLPTETITEKDMPQIKDIIQQALGEISESMNPDGNLLDYETLKLCIVAFQDWLKGQGCVSEVSSTYDIEAVDEYSENIFITHPGQLPFDIVFKMEGDIQKPYRLLIFVTRSDLFNFGSLVENKPLEAVYIPKNWPKDSLPYWENRH